MNNRIRKLGTIDVEIVETTPIVFDGDLYLFEYIRRNCCHNTTPASYFRFVNLETGEIMPWFGGGLVFGSAMVEKNGEVRVFGTDYWGGKNIVTLSSKNLRSWNDPFLIMHDDQRTFFNNSCCIGQNGEYVMAVEVRSKGSGDETIFQVEFMTSNNLLDWEFVDAGKFKDDLYSACPVIRFVNDLYYLIVLHGSYEVGFSEHIYRSKDLRQWEAGKINPVLAHCDEDRKIFPKVNILPEHLAEIKEAENINNSDIDICEYKGKTQIVYSWGDQKGREFLARAESDMPLAEFLESFFKEQG